MRINWLVYERVITTIQDRMVKEMIHMIVREHLIGTSTQSIKDELTSLGILTENPTPIENRRNIVQPFNFVSNNDGAQSN